MINERAKFTFVHKRPKDRGANSADDDAESRSRLRLIDHGLRRLKIAIALILVALPAYACGGEEGSSEPGGSERFDEGEVSVAAERIDVGLVKGNASAEAAEGWRVAGIAVSAVDPKGTAWRVLEFPEGVGTRSATEFFEIVLQELPRGQQLMITATARFENESGDEVERAAVDRWPP